MKKQEREMFGLKESVFKTLLTNRYTILVDDPYNLWNINMQCFDCFALSYHEAIGKMYLERPEFRTREILSISETKFAEYETVTVYESEDHRKLIQTTLETLEKRKN